MNPCNVTIDIFGEPSTFECSSHETAVSITDVFQWGPDGRATKNVVRHYQHPLEWALHFESDPCFADRAFGATFGLYLEDGSVDYGTWVIS